MCVHGGTAYARGGYIYSNFGYPNKFFIDANLGSWHGVTCQTGRNSR